MKSLQIPEARECASAKSHAGFAEFPVEGSRSGIPWPEVGSLDGYEETLRNERPADDLIEDPADKRFDAYELADVVDG